MNNSTAAAMAGEMVHLPSGPGNNEITLGIGLSPELLRRKIDNDKQMREILKGYVKNELKEDHHYSKKIGTMELPKPMLL